MSLQSVLVGALPGYDLTPVEKPAEVPKPKRRTRPRVEWSAARIAAHIGISPSTLTNYLRQHEELRRILGRDGSRRRGDYKTTTAQVEAATEFVLSLPIWSWSMKHPACVRCGKTDARHSARGLCVRCHGLDQWERKGGSHWAYPDAWDKRGGAERCVVCHRSDKPHKGGGMCAACRWWWRSNDLETRTKKEQRRLCAARRRVLRATKGGRRGAGVRELRRRRKNGEVAT